MTLASLVGLLLSRRMGLRSRLIAAAETKSLGLGDVRAVLLGVAKVSLLFEAVTAVLLTGRFWWATTSRSGARSTSGSSTPSRRSTTPASRCTPTA